jgi:membrane-associated phospholipid phosphatase
MTFPKIQLSLILAVLLIFVSCQNDIEDEPVEIESAHSFDNSIPIIWNRLFLEAERFTPGFRPPVGARVNALINFIAYESIVNGSSTYKSLKTHYSDLNIRAPFPDVEYQWEVVLNAAYERSFELFFPTAPTEIQFRILDVASRFREELEVKVDFDVYNNSVQYGRTVADAIYEWSARDPYAHQANLAPTDASYTPPIGLDKWQPTFPDFQAALLPNWGKVEPFANINAISVPPPPAFSQDPNSDIYSEATEAMEMVNEIKEGGLEEESWIAEFWSDDCPILTFSPAGRWVSVALQVLTIEQNDMMESVATFAMVGMAIGDAGVACWREKYRFNRLRPIDYIRNFMGFSDWNTIMCPDGSGNYFTPNFPAYPSGHAAFGGAAAIVLADLYGQRYDFTDNSHIDRTEFNGKPRSYNSFQEMAEENAFSRIPLGVHFKSDSDAGLIQGYNVGYKILELPWYQSS